MSKSAEQWAYGAILDYWDRWTCVRRVIDRQRPRRRIGGALGFALSAAATMSATRAR